MKNEVLFSEKLLFNKISEGDELAFQMVFEQYHRRMLSFVVSLVKSVYAAEEIVQESFIKIWEYRDILETINKPNDYIFIIVRNHALNYLRKISKEQKLREQLWESVDKQTAYVEYPFEKEEAEQLFRRILAKLPPQKQKIFHLSRDLGLSQQEIAEQLNLSKNTVKNHLVESLKVFKLYFKRSVLFFSMFLFIHNQ